MGRSNKERPERPQDKRKFGNDHSHGNGPNSILKKKCSFCGRTGHSANVCRDKKPRQPPGRQSNASSDNAASSHSTTKCFNCKSSGHIARDCDKKRLECNNCGRLGHTANNCTRPQKQRGNARRSSLNNRTPSNGPQQRSHSNGPQQRTQNNRPQQRTQNNGPQQRTQNNGPQQRTRNNTPHNREEHTPKDRVCYNCGGTGHLNKDCKQEKSLRNKPSPWPQHRRLPRDVTALPRDKVKDWSRSELEHIKEFERLAEIHIDLQLTMTRLDINLKNANAKPYEDIMHWNRVDNTKKAIGQLINKQQTIMSLQLDEFRNDAKLCLQKISDVQNQVILAVIKQAQLAQEFHISYDSQTPQQIASYLDAAKKQYNDDSVITARLSVITRWLNNMYASVKETVYKLCNELHDSDLTRKAVADARQRGHQVTNAAKGNKSADTFVEPPARSSKSPRRDAHVTDTFQLAADAAASVTGFDSLENETRHVALMSQQQQFERASATPLPDIGGSTH